MKIHSPDNSPSYRSDEPVFRKPERAHFIDPLLESAAIRYLAEDPLEPWTMADIFRLADAALTLAELVHDFVPFTCDKARAIIEFNDS